MRALAQAPAVRENCQVEIFAVGLRWLPGAALLPINPMLEFT